MQSAKWKTDHTALPLCTFPFSLFTLGPQAQLNHPTFAAGGDAAGELAGGHLPAGDLPEPGPVVGGDVPERPALPLPDHPAHLPAQVATPRSPRSPVPRISRCRTVSAWSSAVCPVATHFAPTSAATSASHGYRTRRAVASRFLPAARFAMSSRFTRHSSPSLPANSFTNSSSAS